MGIKKVTLLLFGLCLVAFLAAQEEGRVTYIRVKAAVANIRAEPNAASSVIQQEPQGTLLETKVKQGEWFKLAYADRDTKQIVYGYVHQSVVEVLPETDPAYQKLRDWQAYQKKARELRTGQQQQAQGRQGRTTYSSDSAEPKPKKFSIGFLGGAGIVPWGGAQVAADLEVPEGWMMDWNTFHWRVQVQGIYQVSPKMSIGGEFGFNSLYYFWWKAPGFTGHEGQVNASNLGVFMEYDLSKNFFVHLGGGLFFFEESSGFALSTGLGWSIPLGGSASIPLLVRYDLVPGGPSPLALVCGIRFKLF